jgi:hypothetical protein
MIDLVLLPEYKSAFIAKYVLPVFSQWLRFIQYNPTTTYPKTAVFVTHHNSDVELANQLWEQGYKIAVEKLWEYREPHPQFHTISSLRWFWINEAYWYMAQGYERYYPTRNWSKLALMPMCRQRPHRDMVLQKLAPYLGQFVWSYHNRMLPNDLPLEKRKPGDNINWQRYFNPEWYDSTSFSIAVETMVTGRGFVTEKTWKPIAYMHPYMIVGPNGTLKLLRSWGFETYNNIFDESYDDIDFNNGKLDIILENVKQYQIQPYNDETRDRVAYNKNRFYNLNLLKIVIQQDIVHPLLEYINAP